MMAIFLPHIYSLVKYEAGQGRKTSLLPEIVLLILLRSVSGWESCVRALLPRRGGATEPSLRRAAGTPRERSPTRLGLSASHTLPCVLLAHVRAKHVIATVELTALTRAGQFNNMRYKALEKVPAGDVGECRRGRGSRC